MQNQTISGFPAVWRSVQGKVPITPPLAEPIAAQKDVGPTLRHRPHLTYSPGDASGIGKITS